MTCIVGVVHSGAVYIGGDRAGVTAGRLSLAVRNDRKVFVTGGFVMGFTTSFRMGQLLAFGFNPPKPRVDQDVMDYMVNDFINAARDRMKAGGFAKVVNQSEEGGSFLVGYQGRLFHIEDDFQVGESTRGFDACGCGDLIALGALHATSDLAPKARVRNALQAAQAFSAGVREPFHIESIPAKSKSKKR